MTIRLKIKYALVAVFTASILSAIPAEAGAPDKMAFAWGADAGGSIDMSGHDMSAIDISASFGFKRRVIDFLGVGAGIDIMLNNSARSFPVFLAFKTNFRQQPSLLFLDLRVGVSANYLPNDYQQTGAYTFAGLGFNLARGKKFASHIVVGYTFKSYKDIITRSDEIFPMNDVHTATVKLGVTF